MIFLLIMAKKNHSLSLRNKRLPNPQGAIQQEGTKKMFLKLIIFFAILSVAEIVIMIILMKKAPIGWEDEFGFHIGKKQQ
jgi:hypothetical protein